jgi:hypothetical protein
MSEQEKPSLDDTDGNCKQCGHPFNAHIVVAYDIKDFSKGAIFGALWRNAVASTPWILTLRPPRNSAISKQPHSPASNAMSGTGGMVFY